MKNRWNIGISKDSSKPMLGLHGLHTAFRGLPNVDVCALVDSKPKDLKSVMQTTEAKRHYADYAEMIDKENLDIVVLCSRHPMDHFSQIEAAAKKGIHIYCEKPMTASMTEADRVIELAEKHRIKIGMAHPARYGPAFRTMKKLIENGEIGTPLTVIGRGKNDHRGGGEDLMVLGTHILDLQTFFFGAPKFVWANITFEGKGITKHDTLETIEPIGPTAGDHIFAYFQFPNNVRGSFETRKGLVENTPNTQMGIAVVGTKGTLSMRFDDWENRSLRISRFTCFPDVDASYEDVPVTDDRVIPNAQPLDYSLCGTKDIPSVGWFLEANRFAVWDLMCAIEADRLPISNMYNAKLTLEMIYAIYASHLTKQNVPLPLTDRKHPLESL